MSEHKSLLTVLGEWWEQHRALMRGAVPSETPVHWHHLLRWMVAHAGTL